jgi:hypothetical protein
MLSVTMERSPPPFVVAVAASAEEDDDVCCVSLVNALDFTRVERVIKRRASATLANSRATASEQ